MKRKAIILVERFFYDFKLHSIRIGGLQTYIHDLARLLVELGFSVHIYQEDDLGGLEKTVNHDGITIHGVKVKNKITLRLRKEKDWQDAFNRIYTSCTLNDLFIISTDCLHINAPYKNVIVIQHGISFDYPATILPSFFKKKLFGNFYKLINCFYKVCFTEHASNIVCVDYNYYNWYRTIGTIDESKHFTVIPNYSKCFLTEIEFENKLRNNNPDNRSIIFARRFTNYRGTLLFLDVAKKLLSEFKTLEITFAGNGKFYNYVKSECIKNNRLHLDCFKAPESVSFHSKFDISVVPTIYSEGTSLSLCEAMAAGCFPIATHVGGMTNIIINKYNGMLSYPDENSFYHACKEAITMEKKDFNTIVNNAYRTALTSFSFQRWKKDWINFIEKITSGQLEEL